MALWLLLAQSPIVEAGTQPINGLDYSGLFSKMLALLILVVLLGVILIKFLNPKARIKGKDASHYFELISSHRLEPKKYIHFVRLGKSYLALGSSEQQLTLLKELSAEEFESL